MDDPFTEPEDITTETFRTLRILIRENYEELSDILKRYIIFAGRANGIKLNSNSFFVDDEEDFDPNVLLDFDSALLHNVAPEDLDKLIEFLKAHPDKITAVTLFYSIAENEEQERCMEILEQMGVKLEKKGKDLNLKSIAAKLLLLEP